jgi:hypothetical protein
MKDFKTIVYDPKQVWKELGQFDKLLKSKATLSERNHLQPFFKKHDQLSAFLGSCAFNLGPGTHLAYEFPFLGDFAADIIVGNRDQREYLVVELEDGAANSVFTKVRGKQTKEWSRRFDHGYSQLIDWFSCLDDYRHTSKFIDEFGHGYVKFYGLLIVGRNVGLTEGNRRRLRWREANVVVNSQSISCITFDDLHDTLQHRLTLYSQSAKLEQR